MNFSEQSFKSNQESNEKDAPEGFVDVSSQNILNTLPDGQRDLIKKHRELFKMLNQAKNKERRSKLFDEQREIHGFSPNDSEQGKVYDLVVDLKDKYR
jgi:hypothetical protein